MKRKQFFVSFWNKKDPKNSFIENGVHGATDEELVKWFTDPNKKLLFTEIAEIEIQEQSEPEKRILRLDLVMKIVKPRIFKEGEIIKPTFFLPLPNREVAPPLEPERSYPIKSIALDSKGNQHINVGLPSKYSSIRSYETGEHLHNGDTIHWCHPCRFRIVVQGE